VLVLTLNIKRYSSYLINPYSDLPHNLYEWPFSVVLNNKLSNGQ